MTPFHICPLINPRIYTPLYPLSHLSPLIYISSYIYPITPTLQGTCVYGHLNRFYSTPSYKGNNPLLPHTTNTLHHHILLYSIPPTSFTPLFHYSTPSFLQYSITILLHTSMTLILHSSKSPHRLLQSQVPSKLRGETCVGAGGRVDWTVWNWASSISWWVMGCLILCCPSLCCTLVTYCMNPPPALTLA